MLKMASKKSENGQTNLAELVNSSIGSTEYEEDPEVSKYDTRLVVDPASYKKDLPTVPIPATAHSALHYIPHDHPKSEHKNLVSTS